MSDEIYKAGTRVWYYSGTAKAIVDGIVVQAVASTLQCQRVYELDNGVHANPFWMSTDKAELARRMLTYPWHTDKWTAPVPAMDMFAALSPGRCTDE